MTSLPPNAIAVTVYDLQGQPLPPKLLREIEQAVEKVVQGADVSCAINLAYS